jgi:hypothetical protein
VAALEPPSTPGLEETRGRVEALSARGCTACGLAARTVLAGGARLVAQSAIGALLVDGDSTLRRGLDLGRRGLGLVHALAVAAREASGAAVLEEAGGRVEAETGGRCAACGLAARAKLTRGASLAAKGTTGGLALGDRRLVHALAVAAREAKVAAVLEEAGGRVEAETGGRGSARRLPAWAILSRRTELVANGAGGSLLVAAELSRGLGLGGC